MTDSCQGAGSPRPFALVGLEDRHSPPCQAFGLAEPSLLLPQPRKIDEALPGLRIIATVLAFHRVQGVDQERLRLAVPTQTNEDRAQQARELSNRFGVSLLLANGQGLTRRFLRLHEPALE